MQSSSDEALLKLTIDASGMRQGSAEAEILGKKAVENFRAIEEASKKLGGTVSTAILDSFSKSKATVEQLERSLNPLAVAVDKAREKFLQLQQIMDRRNENENWAALAQRTVQIYEQQARKVLELNGILANNKAETNSLTQALSGLDQLLNKYGSSTLTASSSSKTMTAEMIKLNTAFKETLISQEQYIELQERIIRANSQAAPNRQDIINQGRIANLGSVQQPGTGLNQGLLVNLQGAAERIQSTRTQANLGEEAQLKLAADAQVIRDKLNPAAASAAAYAKAVNDLKGMLLAGALSQEEFDKALTLPKNKLIQLRGDIDKTTFALGLNRIGFIELQAAGINTFQALAAGMSPWRVAVMESAQVVGAVVQGTDNFGTKLLAFVKGPVGATIAGVTAVAGVFALLLTRTSTNEAQLRKFDSALGSIVPNMNISSVGLQNLTRNLRLAGLSADDAQKSVLALSHNLSIVRSNAAVEFVANTGVDVAARLGVDRAAGIDKVNAAISGGAKALAELGLETRAFSVDEAAAIIIDANHGNSIRAVNEALKLLHDRLAGENKRDMSSVEQATNNVVGAWNRLINTLAESKPFKAVHDGLIIVLNDLSNFISKLNDVPSALRAVYNVTPLGIITNAIQGGAQKLGTFIGQQFPETSRAIGQQLGINGPQLSTGGALNSREQRLTIGVDPRVLEVFQITKEITGENAAITPHGGADIGQHARGSQHYSRNTTSGMGLALDFTLPDLTTGGQLPYNYAPVGSDIYARYKRFNDTFAAEMQRRYGVYGTSGLNFNDPGHVDARGLPPIARAPDTSGFKTGLTNIGMPFDNKAAQENDKMLADIKVKTDALNRSSTDAIEIAKKYNFEQTAQSAFTAKYNELIGQQIDKYDAWTLANIEYNKVVATSLIELEKKSHIQDIDTSGVEKSTKAYQDNTSAGFKADAMRQAQLDHINTGANTQQRYNEILRAGAAEAAKAAAEQLAAQDPVIKGQQKLVEASKQGALAEHDVRVQNEANLITQKALAAEMARGNTVTGEGVKVINDWAKAQILAREAAQNTLDTVHQVNNARDTRQQLQLEIDLQGRTGAEISKQVELLSTAQTLLRERPNMSKEDLENWLKSVAAVGDMKIKLDEAQKSQSRFEDGIKSIADSITNDIGSAITDVFNGNKVVDWGTKIKQVLGQIVSQLATTSLIKPLFGEVFSALGLTNLGSQFGTFGSNSTALNNLFGGSSASNIAGVITTDSSGNLSLKTVGDTLGGASKLSDLFSGGNSGGLFSGGGFLSNSFSALSQGLPLNTYTTAGIFGGGADSLLGAGEIGADLSGSTGLLGSLGGIGGLLGIGGAVLGGVGLLGSLFGLFGGKPKTKNNFGYGGIDVSTGAVNTPFQSAGNRQNDQTTQQALSQISQFILSLKSILPAGATLAPGGVAIATGTKEGTVATFTGPTGNVSMFGNTPEAAVSGSELEIAKNLQGVSATVSYVVNQLTDASNVQDAIKFATAYDDLKTAADAAFSSISVDTKTIGPFKTALDQINTTFSDLTDKANLYNLAVEPITAAKTEALKELTTDFGLFLDTLSNGQDIISPFVNAHKQMVQNVNDAAALGITDRGGQINAIERAQVFAATMSLGTDQLKQVASALQSTAPEISSFINELISAGQTLPDQITQLTQAITDPVGLAIEKEKIAGLERVKIAETTGSDIVAINKYNQLALDEIWKQATQSLSNLKEELTTGSLSGLSPLKQYQALLDKYNAELGMVRGGNSAEISNLAGAAQNLATAAQTDFGNAPRTVALRQTILGDLNSILKSRGFASGTYSTPDGMILVGENGPEWMKMGTGNSIYPHGQTPGNTQELVNEVKMLRMAIENGHLIAKGVGVETVDRLDKVIVATQIKNNSTDIVRQKV